MTVTSVRLTGAGLQRFLVTSDKDRFEIVARLLDGTGIHPHAAKSHTTWSRESVTGNVNTFTLSEHRYQLANSGRWIDVKELTTNDLDGGSVTSTPVKIRFSN